jgi:hypothetical protein
MVSSKYLLGVLELVAVKWMPAARVTSMNEGGVATASAVAPA